MPLSPPAPRKMLHLRDISLRGYQREDGLVDIDAHLTDVKTYGWSNPDRAIGAGEPLHDMWLRVTINTANTIVAAEAVMDGTPYAICPGVAPNYQRLVGLNIGKGFLKAATQALGGIEGCTHLRELLQQIGTVAFQTLYSVRNHSAPRAKTDTPRGVSPLVNTCYAYNETGPLVARLRAEIAAPALKD